MKFFNRKLILKRLQRNRVIAGLFLLFTAGTVVAENAESQSQINTQAGEFIVGSFKSVLDPQMPESNYYKYLTDETTSMVNGRFSDSKEFKEHIKYLRNNVMNMKVTVLNCIADSNYIAIRFISEFDQREKSGKIKHSKLRFLAFYFLNNEHKIIHFEEYSIPLEKDSNNNIGHQSS